MKKSTYLNRRLQKYLQILKKNDTKQIKSNNNKYSDILHLKSKTKSPNKNNRSYNNILSNN